MRMTVAVALHKPYRLPEGEMYLPVQAGAEGREPLAPGMQRDDAGDHISGRNPAFSELTVQYWLWKNREADVYGLCHYRRYFAVRLFRKKQNRILTQPEAERLLDGADVIVPRPRVYLIESNYTQYAHAHHAADLQLAREVIARRHPEYLAAFDRVMKRRWGRRFNMCIMRRAQFDAYSTWLFDILFAMEETLDVSAYEGKDRRVFGYVAERLMDVWLEQTQPRIREARVVHLESQHWPRKIALFLRRRFVSDERLNRRP